MYPHTANLVNSGSSFRALHDQIVPPMGNESAWSMVWNNIEMIIRVLFRRSCGRSRDGYTLCFRCQSVDDVSFDGLRVIVAQRFKIHIADMRDSLVVHLLKRPAVS